MKYVIYFRVSTKRQGESGLGLEAQKRDVELFLNNYTEDYEILDTLTDVESGTSDTRNGFNEAVALAEKHKAELLVAKLDRVSRKVSTVALIMERIKIRVASMPQADNFQLHIYAALAEQEREFISKRTKAALSAAKARGVKLGAANPKWQEKNKGSAEKQRRRTSNKALSHAEKYRVQVEMLISSKLSFDRMSDKLNELRLTTAKGNCYTANSVRNLCKYLGFTGKSTEERYQNWIDNKTVNC